ncbi:hypothetical protein BOH72_08585 [Mycobacterium sp. WY10]|nr:hypothetical protein BOH72_08585 [Mycobacterium sp. WY10]
MTGELVTVDVVGSPAAVRESLVRVVEAVAFTRVVIRFALSAPAAEEEPLTADACLLVDCLRAEPADPDVRLAVDDVPLSLTELAFDAESDAPPSVVADATP